MGLDLFFERRKIVGYFRKVNFLVKYFMNLGFDVEHQTPLYINKNSIEELIKRCKSVLADHNKAKELLPTMNGLFFGNTDYNKYYFQDVQEVLEYCEHTLLPMFDSLDKDEGIYFLTWY